MKYKIIFLFFIIGQVIGAQQTLTIPQIQGKSKNSPYSNQTVHTTGIVTAVFQGANTINGFFLQDKHGDNDVNSSDAIFVYSPNDFDIEIGDEIKITGVVTEYKNRTQLSSISNKVVVNKNVKIEPTKIEYNINNWNWERLEGMLIEFDQTLHVNNNYFLEKDGELELGVKRRPSPTNVALPGSTHYVSLLTESDQLPIYIDDAYVSTYTTPIRFADANGTRRLGEKVDNLKAIVDQIDNKYVLYPLGELEFYGNPRTRQHADIGDYNVKVCSFNIEFYLTSPNSTTMGPSSQDEVNKQHTKIMDALLAIDADIYALQEIEQGQNALRKLVNDLNKNLDNIKEGKVFTYVDDGSVVNGTFTKVAYIYRSDKISTYKSLRNINSPSPINRKKMQAFELKSNGERFILSVNHFKSKSGCQNASGGNIDFFDGQSCYNATRLAEANAVINAYTTNSAYYEEDDLLVVGDLNAYSMEDPIQTFIDSGFVNLISKFQDDNSYSYVYRTEAGTLDHALANKTMAAQVTGATHFHINADELSSFGYDGRNYEPNMYRSSDHDPVIIGLSLGRTSDNSHLSFNERVKIYPSLVENTLNINYARDAQFLLYNINGVKLIQTQLDSNNKSFDLRSIGLEPGIYIVKLMGENSIINRKIIIK